jgi:D-alanyl-lipoteichoic acid acyltransferase DltB (MBOAT superfamily)
MFVRRNVFFPIQVPLTRRTNGRAPLLVASFSFTVAFLLCGLWHQIGWAGVAWGLSQAAGLIACTVYRAILLKWLGRKGLNRYMANRWIRLAAIVLTFEFAAIPVAILMFPFQELTWPTMYLPWRI